MNQTKWERVDKLSGDIYPELMRGLLESYGIPVFLSQEGAGKSAYHVTVGPLSEVEIFVPSEFTAQARELIDAFFAGELEDQDEGDQSNDAINDQTNQG